jgi:MoaA/NifB/PqqE/SkfB family radical SAM enzyme
MRITERIDRVTDVEGFRRVVSPAAPRSVKIEATGGLCNYRCSFCTLRKREEQPVSAMDWELFKRLAVEMREAGVEELGLFYISEPFFKPLRLVECIRYAKEIGFPYVFVTTNGSLANEAHVDMAMKAGLDSLKFSINFSDDEQFTSITGRPARNYAWALENLKAARKIRDENRYPCGIYASSIQFTGEQQERMEKIIAEKVLPYVDEHYWLPLYSFGGADVGVGKPIAGNQGRIGALRDGLPCWSLWEGHIRSSTDGRKAYLSACCFGSDGKFDVADLSEMSFMDAWHSKAFQDLRQAHLNRDVRGTACEKCLAYGD